MPLVLGRGLLTTWPGGGNADLFRLAVLLAFLQRGQGQRAQPALAKTLRALPNEKLSISPERIINLKRLKCGKTALRGETRCAYKNEEGR